MEEEEEAICSGQTAMCLQSARSLGVFPTPISTYLNMMHDIMILQLFYFSLEACGLWKSSKRKIEKREIESARD